MVFKIFQFFVVTLHYNTAVPRQKDLCDTAPLSLFQLYHLYTVQRMSSNDTPNEPLQTHAEDDNSFFVPYHDRLTFNAGHLY